MCADQSMPVKLSSFQVCLLGVCITVLRSVFSGQANPYEKWGEPRLLGLLKLVCKVQTSIQGLFVTRLRLDMYAIISKKPIRFLEI